MEELNENQIKELENYIDKNKIIEDNICLSPKDSEFFSQMLKKILNDKNNTFINVGSSGYRTYSLYKGNNTNIYLFTFFLQNIDTCIIIKN